MFSWYNKVLLRDLPNCGPITLNTSHLQCDENGSHEVHRGLSYDFQATLNRTVQLPSVLLLRLLLWPSHLGNLPSGLGYGFYDHLPQFIQGL